MTMLAKHAQIRNRERHYHFDVPGRPILPRKTREERELKEWMDELYEDTYSYFDDIMADCYPQVRQGLHGGPIELDDPYDF